MFKYRYDLCNCNIVYRYGNVYNYLIYIFAYKNIIYMTSVDCT